MNIEISAEAGGAQRNTAECDVADRREWRRKRTCPRRWSRKFPRLKPD